MDDRVADFGRVWEDIGKLERGEWTSEGEKKLVFDISEISFKHVVDGEKSEGDGEPRSRFGLFLVSSEKNPAEIFIGKCESVQVGPRDRSTKRNGV